MPDGNGAEFSSTGDPRVDAAFRRLQAKNDARFKDLEDAMLVQAQLEARMSRMLREHTELLARHHEMLAKHDEIWRRIDIASAEANDKINFLIDREMRREGGPENRP